jgi:hypothetical protein
MNSDVSWHLRVNETVYGGRTLKRLTALYHHYHTNTTYDVCVIFYGFTEDSTIPKRRRVENLI